MNVGRYYEGYNTHYYVGLANWDGKDLTSLAGKTNVSLALSVQNFVDPVFSNGNTNSQPIGFTYPLVGNYTLKIVALSGTPNFASMNDGWVRTNLVYAPAVGSVTLTNAGYTNVNIGNVVSNWIAAGSGPRWLAFLGTDSTTSIYTSVQLGTSEPTYNSYQDLIAEPAPMYLFAQTGSSTPQPNSTLLLSSPAVRTSRILTENQLEMTFEIVPSVSYVLKTKSSLSDSNWTPVYSFVAASTSTNLTVPMTNSTGRGFYRLEISP